MLIPRCPLSLLAWSAFSASLSTLLLCSTHAAL